MAAVLLVCFDAGSVRINTSEIVKTRRSFKKSTLTSYLSVATTENSSLLPGCTVQWRDYQQTTMSNWKGEGFGCRRTNALSWVCLNKVDFVTRSPVSLFILSSARFCLGDWLGAYLVFSSCMYVYYAGYKRLETNYSSPISISFRLMERIPFSATHCIL